MAITKCKSVIVVVLIAIFFIVPLKMFSDGECDNGTLDFKLLHDMRPLEERLILDGRELIVYVKRIGITETYKKIAVVDQNHAAVNCLLVVNDGIFSIQDGEIILNLHNQNIYGYRLAFSYPSSNKYTPGLIFTAVLNEGKNVADSFAIQWNYSNSEFERRIIDLPF